MISLICFGIGLVWGGGFVGILWYHDKVLKRNDTNELMERIATDMTELILRGKSYDSDKNNVVTIEEARRTRERRRVV